MRYQNLITIHECGKKLLNNNNNRYYIAHIAEASKCLETEGRVEMT